LSIIRTWDDLIAAGITVTKEDVEFAFGTNEPGLASEFTTNLAVIKRDFDRLLRIEAMMYLVSVPHLVGEEMMVVVLEGEEKYERGYGPYLDTSKCSLARYRTAEHLGLDGRPHDNDTYSVLVPRDKLPLIECTDTPAPAWSLDREPVND